MKNIDGKESNTARGVNIASEFKEFKETFKGKTQNNFKGQTQNNFNFLKINLCNTKNTKQAKTN